MPELRLWLGSGDSPGSRSPRQRLLMAIRIVTAGARAAQRKTLCFPRASCSLPSETLSSSPPAPFPQPAGPGREGSALRCARPGRRPLAGRGKAAAAQLARRQHPAPCRVPQRQRGRGSASGIGSNARAARAPQPACPPGSAGGRRQPAARLRLRRQQGLYPLAEGYCALARRTATEAVLRHLRQHFVKGRLIG